MFKLYPSITAHALRTISTLIFLSLSFSLRYRSLVRVCISIFSFILFGVTSLYRCSSVRKALPWWKIHTKYVATSTHKEIFMGQRFQLLSTVMRAEQVNSLQSEIHKRQDHVHTFILGIYLAEKKNRFFRNLSVLNVLHLH